MQKKTCYIFLFVINALVATVKASYPSNTGESCKAKFAKFVLVDLSPNEQAYLMQMIGLNQKLKEENTILNAKVLDLNEENTKLINRKYRDLTIMIGEGITIALLLAIIYKLFHQNKLYKEAAQEVPQAQKTVYLKKVVSKLHEIEKETPKNSTISLLVNQIYNEQLAPEDALFKHNYSTFTKETNKYIDKLNSIQQKLEECHKFSHDNEGTESCLKEIASLSKDPVQSLFTSKHKSKKSTKFE